MTDELHDEDPDHLRAENRRLRAALEQMQDEVMRLGRALEPMHRANEEVERLHGDVERLRGEVERWQAAGHAEQARAERLARELHIIYDSSSWRLTRPLRWLRWHFSQTIRK